MQHTAGASDCSEERWNLETYKTPILPEFTYSFLLFKGKVVPKPVLQSVLRICASLRNQVFSLQVYLCLFQLKIPLEKGRNYPAPTT